MKTIKLAILTSTMSIGFICSYFMELTMQNAEQYLAISTLVFADGFFGILAGIKREGFKTYKAIKILRTLIFWVIMLTVILVIEKSIPGAGWLSETMLMPLVVFQLISTVKNASMAGFIKGDVLNQILDNIDRHKGLRK
jgi:phage-related holin